MDEMVAEIIKLYRLQVSVYKIAKMYGISEPKIVKILVTADAYSTPLYDQIRELRQEGRTDDQIMYLFGMSRKAFDRYIPYKKGMYNLEKPSENAQRIRACRERQKMKKGQ